MTAAHFTAFIYHRILDFQRSTTLNILKLIVGWFLGETCQKSAMFDHVIPGYPVALCSVLSQAEGNPDSRPQSRHKRTEAMVRSAGLAVIALAAVPTAAAFLPAPANPLVLRSPSASVRAAASSPMMVSSPVRREALGIFAAGLLGAAAGPPPVFAEVPTACHRHQRTTSACFPVEPRPV
jgi:hypothetical protein